MTTRTKADIREHRFTASDRLLLDANIWLSVYGPVARRNQRTDVYSRALRDIRRSHCRVYLNVLALSEFINAFARFEFNQLAPGVKPTRFKDFRQSPEFAAVAEEIGVNARKIVSTATLCDSGFGLADIESLLADYQAGHSDFNDQMLAELCKAWNLVLVTDDVDFKDSSDIAILTANKKLLS